MAVVNVPGWIGQSVVDETGERWMATAGPRLGLNPPFWMGSMAGKSAYNLKFTVNSVVYNNAVYRGQWGVGWYLAVPKPSGYSAVEGSFEGHALGSCVAAQDYSYSSVITIQNGPYVPIKITFSDGKVVTFNTDGRLENGYRQYQVDNASKWFAYLDANTGKVLEGVISRI